MIAILDIDGTLVDSNYFHAIAWYRAFRDHGITVPVWEVHRGIGMGGDQMVAATAGEGVEERLGDLIRETEGVRYQELVQEVQPLPGARPLVTALKDRGHTVVMASSAKPEEVEHYLDLLDARELCDSWTTSGDVERTKPEPDLIEAALAKAGAEPDDAIMVGDSVFDVEAAKRAGVKTIAVLTGGFSEGELVDAGADSVWRSMTDLIERLDQTPLR